MDHFFCYFFLHITHAFLYVHCCLVSLAEKGADLLALLYVMFYCVFVNIPCTILG